MRIHPPSLYKKIIECYEYETRNPTIMEMLFVPDEFTQGSKELQSDDKEMKITFNEYCRLNPQSMRLNNLKIYCQTEEDQSNVFDFLFYEYQNDIKYCTWEPDGDDENPGTWECSLMSSHLNYGQNGQFSRK